MTHAHVWSRWIRGRRTGQWFRHCRDCPAQEMSETRQADQERPRGMPDTFSDSQWYSEQTVYIRQRMEKFTTQGARRAWRTVNR